MIGALPPLDGERRRLTAIAGTVPDPRDMPAGCAFAPRCSLAAAACKVSSPPLVPIDGVRDVACHVVAARHEFQPGQAAE